MAQLYSDLLAKGGIPVNQPTNEERDLAAKQAIFDMYKTLRQAGYDSKSAYEAAGMRKTGASMPKEQPQQYDPSMLKDILDIKKKGIDIEAGEMGITKKDIDIEKGRLELQEKERKQESAVKEERIKNVLGNEVSYSIYSQIANAKNPQDMADYISDLIERKDELKSRGINVDAIYGILGIPAEVPAQKGGFSGLVNKVWKFFKE
jgi:hypothetical protein